MCASANAVLSVVNDPEFLASVREKGAYLRDQILGLGSAEIRGVRGMGLMLAVLVDPDKRAAQVNALIEKGVLVLTAGSEAIRLLPPLTIRYEEMDAAVALMKEVFV